MRFQNQIILGVMLVLSSANVFSADTSVAKGVATQSDADKIARMLKEIEQLKNVNQQVLRQIQRLEKELVSTLPQQKKAPVVSPSEPAPTKQANRVASSKRKDVKVKKTPEASRSVTDLEREVHTAFNQTFSLELGLNENV